MLRGRKSFWLVKKDRFLKSFTNVNPFFTHPLRFCSCVSYEHSSKEDTTIMKFLSKVEVCRRIKENVILLSNEEPALAFFSTDLRHIIGSAVSKVFRVMLRGKGTSQTIMYLRHCLQKLSHDLHKPERVQKEWRHKYPNAVFHSIYFQVKG